MIQTQDLQNRNLTLYSAKLRDLRRNALVAMTAARRHWATAKFSRSFLPAIGVIAGTHYQTSIQEVFHLLTRAHVALVILRSYDLFYYYALVAETAACGINRGDLLRK